jgi:hypothetical protein
MDFLRRVGALGGNPETTTGLDVLDQQKLEASTFPAETVRQTIWARTGRFEGEIQKKPKADNIGLTVGRGHNLVTKPIPEKVRDRFTDDCVRKVLRDMRYEDPARPFETEQEVKWLKNVVLDKFGRNAQLPENWKKGDPMWVLGCNFELGEEMGVRYGSWEALYDADIDDAIDIAKRFIMGTLDRQIEKKVKPVSEEVWNHLPRNQQVVLGDMGFQAGIYGKRGGIAGFGKARDAFIAGNALIAAREMLWNGPGAPTPYQEPDWKRAYKNAYLVAFGYEWTGRLDNEENERRIKNLLSYEALTKLDADARNAAGTSDPPPEASAPGTLRGQTNAPSQPEALIAPSQPEAVGAMGDPQDETEAPGDP